MRPNFLAAVTFAYSTRSFTRFGSAYPGWSHRKQLVFPPNEPRSMGRRLPRNAAYGGWICGLHEWNYVGAIRKTFPSRNSSKTHACSGSMSGQQVEIGTLTKN
jgi:hypothetical protein